MVRTFQIDPNAIMERYDPILLHSIKNPVSAMKYKEHMWTALSPEYQYFGKRKYENIRGDMIQVYKILCKKDRVDSERMLPLNRSRRTRGHSMKLEKRLGKLNVRKYSFGHRVTNKLNSLPEWVVCAKTVSEFKDNNF